jgi:hypothetical protein
MNNRNKMKKNILVCLFSTLSIYGFAQNSDSKTGVTGKNSFTSKNGHEVLPQAGEYCLGLYAGSFLAYFGNTQNGSSFINEPFIENADAANANAIGSFSPTISLTGKYMKSANLAYRGRFALSMNSENRTNQVLKSNLTPDPLNPEFVTDKQSIGSTVMLLSGGIEKRRGSSRLQGFYGGEVIIGYSHTVRETTYGNSMSPDFNDPLSTTVFSTFPVVANTSSRETKQDQGTQFLLGARGFVGAEYFFAPKMSIGAEIGYTLGMQTNGKVETTTETFDANQLAGVSVKTKTQRNAGLTSWGIGLDRINAGINLLLYF